MQTEKPRKWKYGKRWVVLGTTVLILVAGIFLLTTDVGGLQQARAADPAQEENVVAVIKGDLAATSSASGRVEATQVVQLSADTPALVEGVSVRVGDIVSEGDALVKLETTDLALRVARAEQNLTLNQANLEALLNGPRAGDVAAAEAAVFSAQVNLDNLAAGPTEQDMAASEADWMAQQASVALALAVYQGTLDSISDSAVAAAEADLVNAQITYDEAKEASDDNPNGFTFDAFEQAAEDLAIAQAALDELLDGPNRGKLDSAVASIASATASADQAGANHRLLLSGTSASQIAAAKANLAQAQANLANLTAGTSAETITVATAQVEQSRLALADAQEALAEATVVSPFDGLVTAVSVTVGEFASGPVVEIASNDPYVLLNVDEVDIGALRVGQPAVVTLETWPDVEIAAEIIAIAPSANVDSDGIVSFDVHLSLSDVQLPILVGMTANAHLVTAERENVLLVPNAALTADREAGTYSVRLVTGESNGSPTVDEVQVTIGIRDPDFTEITGGLSDGDRVAISELKAPTQQFGPFGGSQ